MIKEKEQVLDTIQLKGVAPEQIVRYTKIVMLLIANGGLDVKDGETVIRWADGFLNEIDVKSTQYRRDVPPQFKRKEER